MAGIERTTTMDDVQDVQVLRQTWMSKVTKEVQKLQEQISAKHGCLIPNSFCASQPDEMRDYEMLYFNLNDR